MKTMLCDFYTKEDNTCDIDKECLLLCNGEMKSDRCLFCVKDLEMYKKIINKRNVEYVKQYYRENFGVKNKNVK